MGIPIAFLLALVGFAMCCLAIGWYESRRTHMSTPFQAAQAYAKTAIAWSMCATALFVLIVATFCVRT